MPEIKVKHFLDGLIHLDIINLEEKLNDSPNLELFSSNVFIDLSKCQFAELGALTQLILIIESYLKQSHKIYIALPTTKLTTKQIMSIKDPLWSQKSLDKQKATTNFIIKTGFVSLIQNLSDIYNNEVYFTDVYDYVKKGEEINIDSFSDAFSIIYDDMIINESNYKFLLPFKLIDCEKGIDEIKDFEKSLDKVLLNPERGLENFDVKVIKNVILSELIKNVKIHSHSKYAVFVVGLINSNSIFLERNLKKINPIEKKHLDYLSINNIESQVEIYFGDSGIGLLNEQYNQTISKNFGISSANKKELLEFSFNKWSTIQDNEPRRGTKGLYRLKRIVDKYKGIVHIKTFNSNGGFFNGKFEYREAKSSFKGTLLSVKLNPFKEIKTFKLASINNAGKTSWISEKIKVDRNLDCLSKVRKKIIKGNNLLLITDITEVNLSTDDSKILEEFLYQISYISHPSAIVLYLIKHHHEIDNDTIDLLTESVQSRINQLNNEKISPENESPDFDEVHDPVLLIGKNNQTFWYGGSNKLIKIINESYSKILSSENSIINKLSSYNSLNEENQIEIRNYLETDSNLVVLNNKGEIEFNFYGIENHYENKILNFKPKIEDKIICTPKLNIINTWIDIVELLKDDEYGFALCLYLKYRKNYESKEEGDISKLDRQNTFILIDHTQQFELTKKFSELLGLKNKNIRNIEEEIDFSMPKRTKLFNDGSKVIFLTTIVSSSETIRRMVKYAKRDKAIPDIVLSIMNYRKNKIKKLETWNETTEIISIYQKHIEEAKSLVRDNDYFKNKVKELKTVEIKINPNFIEETQLVLSKSIVVENQLLNFIKDNKFLYYNHYGQNNKRHFTFYLDKVGIIDSVDSIICDKLIQTISAWRKEKSINDFTLYINHSIINQASKFQRFLKENFTVNFKSIDIKNDNINQNNSIYLDFGILTGESINHLINKVDNVDNLLICLLFNQSINSNATIYKKIKSLQFDVETSLIPTENDKKVKNVDFQIEYLYDLPLSFFNSENCPICEHRRALDYYKFEESYFKLFSNDRIERLKQNSTDDIFELNYPVDFYYSDKTEEKNQELSREIIFQMYEFKILLENASNYTKYRIELFEMLYNLNSKLEEELQNSESKIYAILYYLSHEINWLQNEPLIFRDFRIILSNISYKIATIDFNNLKKHFEKTNKYNIPNNNLATRYKYASISVLRSTDKLLFCKSIFEIVNSSLLENKRFSDNLLQNTLYHISSFFKNTYNKSELYFLEIENNLNKLLENYSHYTQIQINAIKFVVNQNKLFLINFRKIKDEPKAFKKMKEQWEKLYFTEMPKHPEPYQEFKSLQSLEQHIEILKISKTDTSIIEEIELLKSLISKLPARINIVRQYIHNNFTFYFSDQLQVLLNSKYFHDEFINSLNIIDVNIKIDRLHEIIKEVIIDMHQYLTLREEYNSLYKSLLERIFNKRNIDRSINDSKFIDLLNDFPLSIPSIISEVFSKNEFPEMKLLFFYKNIELDFSNINVYFPKSIFQRHLENIKNNLNQKLNKNVELKSTILQFTIILTDDEFVLFEMKYNNTDQWCSDPNPNGSLNTLKKHIESFKGDFEYYNEDKYFILKFKFLRYD